MNNIIDITHSKHFHLKKVEVYDYCDYYIDESLYVVYINFTKHVMFNSEMGKTLFYKAFEYFPNEKLHVIINITDKTQIESNILDFIASEERVKKINSDAFIIKSTTLKLISNFYLRIKKPKIKTKVFNDADAAFEWTLENIMSNSLLKKA